MKFLNIYLLQFQVHAEEKLLHNASTVTKEARDALKLRTQQYQIEKQNNWIKSSQNKHLKSSLPTSTLPEEDIAFKKDESYLSKSLFKATLLETIQKSTVSAHSATLSALTSHLPSHTLALQKSMKLYRKLASEMVALEEMRRLKKSENLLLGRENGLKVLNSMVVGEFVKVTEMGEGRDWAGNLAFMNGDLEMAEVYWEGEVRRWREKGVEGGVKGGSILGKMAKVLDGMMVDRQYDWVVQGRMMFMRVFGF